MYCAFCSDRAMPCSVSCTDMSFCNHKLTNRGFGKGPFCPIYGFGGVLGYLILSPLRGKLVKLYFLGAILATTFEYLVGIGMIRFLGELWWDYNNKPFNYRGIICLESTVAWGFYAIGIVQFVHDAMYHIIDRVQIQVGIRLIQVILAIVAVLFILVIVMVMIVETIKQYKKMWNEISQMFLIGSLSGIAVLGDVIRGYLPVNLILLFVFVNMGIILIRMYLRKSM